MLDICISYVLGPETSTEGTAEELVWAQKGLTDFCWALLAARCGAFFHHCGRFGTLALSLTGGCTPLAPSAADEAGETAPAVVAVACMAFIS